MQLDLICLGLVLFMVTWGWLKGGLLRVVHIGSLAVASVAAVWAKPIVMDLLKEYLGNTLPYPPLWAMGGTFILVFLVLNITLSDYVQSLIDESDSVSSMNRILGASLGLATSVVIITVSLVMFSHIKDTVFRHKPELVKTYQSSKVVDFVMSTSFKNLLLPSQLMDTLRLEQAMKDPAWKEKLENTEELESLIHNPVFETLRQNEEAMALIQSQDMMGLLQNDAFQDVLSDPKLMELFENKNIGDLLKRLKEQNAELPELPDDPF